MNNDTTNGEIEDVLNQHLAASEIVKSVLTVRSGASGEESGAPSTVGQDVYILAVVSSSESVEEEGRYLLSHKRYVCMSLFSYFSFITSVYSSSNLSLGRIIWLISTCLQLFL